MVNGLKYWQYLLFKSSIMVLKLVVKSAIEHESVAVEILLFITAERRVTFVVNVRQV